MNWAASKLHLFRALAAWLQLGRLHALNGVITALWLAYFDATVQTPLGVRSLPMYFAAPLLITLVACQPLAHRDSALIRQTAGVSNGSVAAVRLAASLSIWSVGIIALWLRGGTVLVGLPLVVMSCGIVCASVAGEFYWAPLCLAFLGALPWVLSDAGTSQVMRWSTDGRIAILGAGAVVLASAWYFTLSRAPRRLRAPIALE